jgi:hypothetical protein
VPVHLGGGLRWEVNSAAGDKVEIEFNNPGGPFAHDPNNPHNPRKGRYETMQPTDIDSNPATAKGRWKYTVTWTPAGGAAIILDPEVCIRGG